MINENGYMLDMRSMGPPPGMHQEQQHQHPQVAYTHTQHQNMGMYAHMQQPHIASVVEHKYPQNIMIQHTAVAPQTYQISYIQHHSLMNLSHQVSQKQEPLPPPVQMQVVVNSSPPKKTNKVTKPRSKGGAAKIVKRKPQPPPPLEVPAAPPPAIPVEEKPQKKKGRKRKYIQSREERKENMYKNLPYINSRNQEVKPKEFEDYDCKCPLRCRKRVSVEARRKEFEAFYALGSYTAQNIFLLERIKEVTKNTKIPKVGKKKNKKKSPRDMKKKNFPKMSSSYKWSSHFSSDEDEVTEIADCKDPLADCNSPQISTKIREELSEDKKCITNDSNSDNSIHVSSIKDSTSENQASNAIQVIESQIVEYPNTSNNHFIIEEQKNGYYQYKDANIHPTHTIFISDQDQQVPNIESNSISVQSSLPDKQDVMQNNTLSVLQVVSSLPNSVQINAQDVKSTISNLEIRQMINTSHNSNLANSQMTCVNIHPTQHIIYTGNHITYGDRHIVYQIEQMQDDNGCSTAQILCPDQQNVYHTQDISLIQEDVLNNSCIETVQNTSTKRKRKPFKAERKFTRIYHLKKIRVCREMFVKTLKISSGRVNTVLKKNRSGDGLYRHSENQGGHNKLTEQQKAEVCSHISSMLQFMGHDPNDVKTQNISPFPSGFSLKSIYKVYKTNKEIAKPVSFTSYSRIFYKEFGPKKTAASVKPSSPVKKLVSHADSQLLNQYSIQSSQVSDGKLDNESYKSFSNITPHISSRLSNQEPIYANSLPVNKQQIVAESSASDSECQPKKKGRKRKYGDLTRQERKYNMYRNLPYVNSKMQQVLPKEFEDFDCQCPLKCRQRVSPKERKREFEGYYSLGSYISQNMYLLDRVEECKKRRCYIKNRPAKRERNFSRIYKLSKVRVCREMFLKTLKISSVRVNTVLNKKRSGEELTYKRGLNQGGMNKITDEQKNAIVDHINCIISSLTPSQQLNAEGDLVFPQEYTFKRMYEIYLENNRTAKSVSFSTYRRVFSENFDFKL